MKIILLILLLPLVNGLPRISLSCFLLGTRGCEYKCYIKCLLLDCSAQNIYCDGWHHCECSEVYQMGSTQLTTQDFENLELDDLWNNVFERNEISIKILERIRKNKKAEEIVLSLLRNPYMTGEDIVTILGNKYPKWSGVTSLESRQHGLKTKFMEAGKPIQYNDLDAHLDTLIELINTIPPDDTNNSRYKLRVKNFLRNITNVDDLEELLHLVKLSQNKSLYRLMKSSLRNLGYGFEEDGDGGSGKKAILKTILLDIDEADDDEKLEVAVANKFPTKRPSSGRCGLTESAPKQRDVDPLFVHANPKSASLTGVNGNFNFGSDAVTSATLNGHVTSLQSATNTWPNDGDGGSGNSMLHPNEELTRYSYVIFDSEGKIIRSGDVPKQETYSTQWIGL